MHDLALIGASYRTVGIEALGRLLLPRSEQAGRVRELAARLGVEELLYLGTCNRLEVLVRLAPGQQPEELRGALFEALAGREAEGREARRIFRVWTGAGAVEHLLTVACGLDSAQVGDREIANQLRDAWLAAREAGVSGPRLDQLMPAALLAAREVRELEAADGMPARKGLAARAARHALTHLAGSDESVALLGVSAMTRSAARVLARERVPLIVVNRSLDAATHFAAEIGGVAMSLAAFSEAPPPVGAVVTAVGTAEPVIDGAHLERLSRGRRVAGPVLIVDLGVPANVGAEAAQAAGLAYIGMDQLVGEAAADRPQQLAERTHVRAIVDRHLDRAMRASAERLAGPLLGALHESYVQSVESELSELLHGSLAGLDEGERTALRRWGSLMARRMAHVPVDGLRRLASEGDLESVEACIDGMTRALEKRRAR